MRGRSLAPRRTIASSLLTRIVRSPSHLRTHFPLFHHCRRYLDMARRASFVSSRPACLSATAADRRLSLPQNTYNNKHNYPSAAIRDRTRFLLFTSWWTFLL